MTRLFDTSVRMATRVYRFGGWVRFNDDTFVDDIDVTIELEQEEFYAYIIDQCTYGQGRWIDRDEVEAYIDDEDKMFECALEFALEEIALQHCKLAIYDDYDLDTCYI